MKERAKMLTEIAVPLVPFAAMCISAVIGVCTITLRAVGIMRKKNGNGGSGSGINTDRYVTKEVCAQTQNTIHAEMKIISEAVKHTNTTLLRVEKSQNEKLEQVIKLIKKNGN